MGFFYFFPTLRRFRYTYRLQRYTTRRFVRIIVVCISCIAHAPPPPRRIVLYIVRRCGEEQTVGNTPMPRTRSCTKRPSSNHRGNNIFTISVRLMYTPCSRLVARRRPYIILSSRKNHTSACFDNRLFIIIIIVTYYTNTLNRTRLWLVTDLETFFFFFTLR